MVVVVLKKSSVIGNKKIIMRYPTMLSWLNQFLFWRKTIFFFKELKENFLTGSIGET